jgi:hypothetical protein
VEIIFAPITAGSFDANLVIPSNDTDEPTVTVDLHGSSGPDLTGTWSSLTQTYKNTKKGIKCKIKGKLNIKNIGTQNAVASHVKFYLSDDNIYDEGDMLLKRLATGKIKPGKSQTKSLFYSFPYGTSVTDKYVIAILDTDNKVIETDKSNNNIAYGPIQ